MRSGSRFRLRCRRQTSSVTSSPPRSQRKAVGRSSRPASNVAPWTNARIPSWRDEKLQCCVCTNATEGAISRVFLADSTARETGQMRAVRSSEQLTRNRDPTMKPADSAVLYARENPRSFARVERWKRSMLPEASPVATNDGRERRRTGSRATGSVDGAPPTAQPSPIWLSSYIRRSPRRACCALCHGNVLRKEASIRGYRRQRAPLAQRC